MNDQKKAPELTSGETSVNSGDEIEGQNARISRYSKAKKKADQHRQYIENHCDEYPPKQKGSYPYLNRTKQYLLL